MTIWHNRFFIAIFLLFLISTYLRNFLEQSQKIYLKNYSIFLSCNFVTPFYLNNFRLLCADWYWLLLLANQHSMNAEQFFRNIEYITALDTHYTVVYRYAFVQLFHCKKMHQKLIPLLEHSLTSTVNQTDWRLSMMLAYAYEHWQQNPHKAYEQLCLLYSQQKRQSLLQSKTLEIPHYIHHWHNRLQKQLFFSHYISKNLTECKRV